MEYMNFSNFSNLKDFGVFYLQKSARPFGPVVPGEG
jgi:hypothetical protein